MKKFFYLVILLLAFFPSLVLAQTYSQEDIEKGSYVIGKYLFNKNKTANYDGTLTTPMIMLASKSIESNNLNDMIIYYKNSRGRWVNAITGQSISNVPSNFDITCINLDYVSNFGVASSGHNTYGSSEIANGVYLIGKYLFNKDKNGIYDGTLTTPMIMLSSKSIESNNLSDMIIYYKNSRGRWVNAITGQSISNVPSVFNVSNINLETIINPEPPVVKIDDTILIDSKTVNYSNSDVTTTATSTSGQSVSLSYYSNSTCTVETTPHNAGVYYVVGRTSGNTNYNATVSGCTQAITINKINDTILIDNKTVNYSNSDVTTTATSTSGQSVSLSYYSNSTCTVETTPHNAGVYYVVGRTSGNTNYNATVSGCTQAITINENTYNLTIDLTGGHFENNGNTVIEVSGLTRNTSAWSSIPIATRTNYILKGYFTSDEMVYDKNGRAVNGTYWNNDLYQVSDNLEVFAVWESGVELLKDSSFSRGFTMFHDDNNGNYQYRSCDNPNNSDCSPYFYIASWNNSPDFSSFRIENGTHIIETATHDKSVEYKDGEVKLSINTQGKTYSSEGNSWPHLLIGGLQLNYNGLNTQSAFESKIPESERSYYYFSSDNIIEFNADVKLNNYQHYNDINGISAAQFLINFEVYCKASVCGSEKMFWLQYNVFDDRGYAYNSSDGQFSWDDKTNSASILLPSKQIFTGDTLFNSSLTVTPKTNGLYNSSDFVYGEWRNIHVDLSSSIEQLLFQLNNSNMFDKTIKASDLRFGGFNIGYEVHGEYDTSISFKNLSLTSKSKYIVGNISNYGYDWVTFDNDCVSNIDTSTIENNFIKNDSNPYLANKGLDHGSLFISPFYETYINGTKVDTYASYAYVPDLSQSTLHSFTTIQAKDNLPLNIELKAKIDVNSVNVLPKSLNTTATVNNNTISLTVKEKGQYTILVNGNDQRYAYTIFVEDYYDDDREIDNYINAGYNVIEYSGYNPINYIDVSNSNTVLYLRKGSCLVGNHTHNINSSSDDETITESSSITMGLKRYPFINTTGKDNVKIVGNGMIDLSKLDFHERKGIIASYANNIEISRLLFINMEEWSLTTYKVNGAKINNIKMFNYRQNTDGIAITNSQNVDVSNSYIRSGDDLFEVKTLGGDETAVSNNIIFDNCIGWASFARGIGITGEVEKDISNVTFKNSAIIYRDATWDNNRLGGLVVIKENGGGNISNITFDNIEIFHESGRPFNVSTYGSCSTCSGSINNVVFNNISYTVDNVTSSLNKSLINANSINNIKFYNITANGNKWISPYTNYLELDNSRPFDLYVDNNKVFTYSINYNNNGGSGCSNKIVAYNDTFEPLCEPIRSGYTFIGWFGSNYKDNPLNYYADNNPDLKAAYGYDATSLYNHYISFGINEGRRISEYINSDIFTGNSNITLYAGWYKNN